MVAFCCTTVEDGSNRNIHCGLIDERGEFITTAYDLGGLGYYPTAVALGDIDGDYDLDAAIVASYDDGALIMLNSGSGTFSSPTYYFMDGAYHVVLSDITGDGNSDLLASSFSKNNVIIRPGTGSGSFGELITLSTSVSTSGVGPVWITVADINDDMVPDILTANQDSNDITLFVGTGSGSFNAPIIIPSVMGPGDADVSCVLTGHFNNDKIPDIAAVNTGRDTVSIIMGFGSCIFSAPQSFDVGVSPYSIVVEDFNGDSIDDIASANYSDGTITVLMVMKE
jgi:hypothetical protein